MPPYTDWVAARSRLTPYRRQMISTPRQQLVASIESTERELAVLKSQSQPDQHSIEGEEKELGILKAKLDATIQ